jgi:hypothetical protein
MLNSNHDKVWFENYTHLLNYGEFLIKLYVYVLGAK